MKNKTKGQLEAQISEVVIKFEKEFMGRGPLETKAYLIDDMVLVRLRNVLTQAELKLASTPESRTVEIWSNAFGARCWSKAGRCSRRRW